MTRTRAKTPAGVLRAAARYIEEHGWVQGIVQDREGRVCAVGALGKVLPARTADSDDALYYEARALADERARERAGGWGSVVAFNDSLGRTQAEVVALLRG